MDTTSYCITAFPSPEEPLFDRDVEDLNVLLRQLSPLAPWVGNTGIYEISVGGVLFFVRESEHGRIVGMATLLIERTLRGMSGYVHDVVVYEAHRKRGIGKSLNEKVIMVARELGMRHLELTSNLENPDRANAIDLYLKLGYLKRNTGVFRLKL